MPGIMEYDLESFCILLLAGFEGTDLWEKALNDVIVETMKDSVDLIIKKVTVWKIIKVVPEPEDSAQILEEVRAHVLKGVNYVQSVTEKRGKKFTVGDKVR